MKNILVTGGAGFIGSNFIHYLQRIEPEARIVNLDALTYAANVDNLRDLPDPGRYAFVQGDVCDRGLLERLFRDHEIGIVVHFAAESHVDRSISAPDLFVQTNVVGTLALLEAARRAWLGGGKVSSGEVRFHHVSTDEVFGSLSPGEPAFKETNPYAPNSPYAASKAASDHLVRAYFHTYGLPVTISNCSNNYGPFQFPEKLIPLMILNAVGGRPLPIYGDGLQIRDWLYVEDHCEAIWTIIRKGRPGETYNIGGNNQPANIEVVREICAVLDDLLPRSAHVPHERLCQTVADRPGHDRRYAMNVDKIRAELGWRPREDIHSGLRKTVQWYLDNEKWVRGITDRPEYGAWIDKNYGQREKKS